MSDHRVLRRCALDRPTRGLKCLVSSPRQAGLSFSGAQHGALNEELMAKRSFAEHRDRRTHRGSFAEGPVTACSRHLVPVYGSRGNAARVASLLGCRSQNARARQPSKHHRHLLTSRPLVFRTRGRIHAGSWALFDRVGSMIDREDDDL
jgi:hypothetical protein